MLTHRKTLVVSLLGGALLLATACGSDDASNNGSAGSTASGGQAQAGAGGQSGGAGGTAAGGTAGGGTAGGSTAGQGGSSGAAGQGGSSGTAGSNSGGAAGQGGSSGQAACATLAIDLHQGSPWYVSLKDMKTSTTKPAAWAFTFAKSSKGPWITLAQGVEAQNLGNAKPFDQVDTAPDSGYSTDENLIGNTWRSGGEGETGFEMSKNVYVFHLPSGLYAKMTVLEAKAGKIKMAAFTQLDGSKNLHCTP